MLYHGYAVIVVERPGTGASFGLMDPSFEVGAAQADEILDWIAAQDWCDGNIGMYGDSWQAMIRFKSGTTVGWTYSRSMYGETVRQANYYGSAGTMMDLGFPFHPFQCGGNCVLADGTEISSEQIQADYLAGLSDEQKARLFPYGTEDGFAIEVWDFVDAIATGRQPEMDGYDGLRAKALCDACYESSTLGKPVKYADVLAGKISAYQAPIDECWGL